MVGKRIAADFKFRPKKCAKRHHGDEDRISQLPDDILINLLSRLPLKESARTSVLSSRWVNLWKHIPRLVFDATRSLVKIGKDNELLNVERCKYVNWVNRVLRSHYSYNLKELSIRFNLNKSSKRAITYWLNSAFARQVQKLELDLVEEDRDLYTFPERFLKQRSDGASALQNSSQNSFINNPHKFIIFKSLRELSLKCVNVTGGVIESLLHKCPILEHLVVHWSYDLVDLEISGPSLALKHLEIWYCHKFRSIKVSNSNIVSLSVHRLEFLKFCRL